MKSLHESITASCALLLLTSFAGSGLAATDTWSGGGTDANWGTTGNWTGGNPTPASGDNLFFGTAAQQNNNNNLAGLSINTLDFTAGGFTLNGNGLTLNPTTPGIITNSSGLNIINLPLTITPAAKYWSILPNTELRLAAPVVDNAASGTPAGWLCLTNGGTVRILSTAGSARGMDLFQGTVIVDGGLLSATNDGIRFKPPTGSTATVVITNNGTIHIGGGGNFRMGHNGTGIGGVAGAGSLSQAYLSSGTLALDGPATSLLVGDLVAGATGVFNQNGGLVWGSYSYSNATPGNTLTVGNSANATGTYNQNGGLLWIGQIQANSGATNTVFNMNGGTIKPAFNSTTFFQGLSSANVQNGGVTIDTTNLNITIAQSLLAAGTGGLTKLGTGTLTLTGNNTYTGPTVVNNGTLIISYASQSGNGPLTVANTGNLNITYGGSPIQASSLNAGSSATNSITLNFGTSPTPNGPPFFNVTSLNGSGVALINITGSGFTPGSYPLVAFANISGSSSFQLGTMPLGLTASLGITATGLNLNVSLVPKNLEWSGALSANWNTTTFNWNDLNNNNNPTNYTQANGVGDAVLFDDNGGANPNVNLSLAVTPSQLNFNNNSTGYTFAGAGKISGGVAPVMNGYAPITFGTVNDFTGGATINAGTVYLAADQALGTGPSTLNAGTLASDSTNPRLLPNPVILNAATGIILGDPANTGTLTLAGGLNLAGLTNTLNFNSDVVVSGPLSNGGIGTKTGPGALIVEGTGLVNAQGTQTSGNTVINGGQLTNLGDGWRMEDVNSGTVMDFAITNGGSFVMNNLVNGNFRLGLAGDDTSTSYTLDVAGLMVVLAPGNGSVSGHVLVGVDAVKATVNLWPGGNLICGQVTSGGTSDSEVDFYGGTLTPTFSSAIFFQGLTNAFVQNGGVFVDTTNLSITIAQPLLAAGSGGLTKLGVGTLTLTGTNTYVGQTVVNAGKLALGPGAGAPGGVAVNANGTLAFLQTSAANTVTVPSVTIGGGTNSALEADLAGTTTPAGTITNLILNGTTAINVSGPLIVGEFPLFGFGAISGPGSLAIGQLPQGTLGHLVTNTSAKTIDLVVSAITPTVWTGATNGNWDTTTTNWLSGNTPVAYKQLASVLFNDAASNAAVTLNITATPSAMVVSNTALPYGFAGSGGIGGSLNLAKWGTNSLGLATANTFIGSLTIQGGILQMSNAAALGASSNPVYVTNSGTLDISGNGPALEPVIIAGGGANGGGALVNFGADQNNAYRNVTMTGDATVGGPGLIGLRTMADSDPGLIANGHNLTKVGTGQFNLNGGTTVAGLTNVWGTDLGNVDIKQGTFSFERRCALGLANNTITVEAGAILNVFSLNQTLPVPPNQIVMTNAGLQANAGTPGDVSTLGGAITLNGTNSISTIGGAVLDLDGSLVGSGGAVFNGSINLAGPNTFAGPTVVSNSTLVVAAGGTLAGSTNITVLPNATLDVSAVAPWTLGGSQTLDGYGTVNGSVVAKGTVAPGTTIGTLTFNNDLTLSGTTVLALNKSLPGQTNDIIVVDGALTYGGALKVVVEGSTPLAVGDSFQLFSFASAPAGEFAATNLPAGYTWDASQLAATGTITVSGISNRPHPRFIAVTVSGHSIVLSGTNAVGTYVLYGTTNLLPANWVPVYTDTFAGSFSFTNTTGAQQQFYLLQ